MKKITKNLKEDLNVYPRVDLTDSEVSLFTKVYDSIILDQTTLDPAQMLSGDINGPIIQWIRSNSHRYLGKKSGEGEMTIAQLHDNDSTKFYDGTSADLTGAEGDVFMKLPRFFWEATEKETDIWDIKFS